jgi:hypothetical protein
MVMVAYSFQKQFVPAIISGKKRQTIRAFGKRRHAYVGEPIQLYVGMRTKQCAKIIPDQICKAVAQVGINVGEHEILGIEFLKPKKKFMMVTLLCNEDMEKFARRDGFDSLSHMHAFWKHAHGTGKFMGVLIGW